MFFFFQAEDGIRDLVRSRGLGDVYKRQHIGDLIPTAVGCFRQQLHVLAGIDLVQHRATQVGLSLIHI